MGVHTSRRRVKGASRGLVHSSDDKACFACSQSCSKTFATLSCLDQICLTKLTLLISAKPAADEGGLELNGDVIESNWSQIIDK